MVESVATDRYTPRKPGNVLPPNYEGGVMAAKWRLLSASTGMVAALVSAVIVGWQSGPTEVAGAGPLHLDATTSR